MSIHLAVYNGQLDTHWHDVAVDHWSLGGVAVPVRVWLPVQCPDCGSTGPFRALANWVPVLVDGTLDVVEVDPDGEEVWPVLDGSGPGLQCRTCDAFFDLQRTIERMG